jgi:serine/threonine protein kinase
MLQDIKSPNVLLSADCTAKIADVGLAKMQNQTFLSVNQEAIGECCQSFPPACGTTGFYATSTMECNESESKHKPDASCCIAGTFTWTAPEILMGLRCTEKCDLFSFGVVLWEVITGETPQRGRLRSIQ